MRVPPYLAAPTRTDQSGARLGSGHRPRRWRRGPAISLLVLAWTAQLLAEPARFDPVAGVVSIPAVVVGATTYTAVTLQHLGNYVFRLLGAGPQSSEEAEATYNAATGVLWLPDVRVGPLAYTATFQNVGNFTFHLRTARPRSRISDSSYANFKAVGLQPQALPVLYGANARAYGDFFGDEQLALFTAELVYDVRQPQSEAVPARYRFWRREPDGGFTAVPELLDSLATCLHPRKAIVADFNGDARPDVFVACHGYDAPPYPGEHNDIVLSQPDGRYRVRWAGPQVGFFHSASSTDVNGDGWPDVVVTNNFDPVSSLIFLINQGDGSFQSDYGRMPPGLAFRNYYSVELVDVSGDGIADLLFGGHEWENQSLTRVLINPGTFDFRAVPFINLPQVPGNGVVLDFVVTFVAGAPSLWILRTAGGPTDTFYDGVTIQRVTGPPLSSSVVYQRRPGPWVDWMIPAVINGQPVLTSDDAAFGLLVSR